MTGPLTQPSEQSKLTHLLDNAFFMRSSGRSELLFGTFSNSTLGWKSHLPALLEATKASVHEWQGGRADCCMLLLASSLRLLSAKRDFQIGCAGRAGYAPSTRRARAALGAPGTCARELDTRRSCQVRAAALVVRGTRRVRTGYAPGAPSRVRVGQV